MLIIISLIFLITYLLYCFYGICKYLQFKKCMRKHKKFIKSYQKGKHNMLFNDNFHSGNLNSLLRYYPVIYKYFSSPELLRTNSDYENFDNSLKLYNQFLDKRDFKRHDMYKSFHPINTVNLFLSFPYNLLCRMGFRPRKANELLINIIGSIIELIFIGITQIYSEEIKLLIQSVLEYFIH